MSSYRKTQKGISPAARDAANRNDMVGRSIQADLRRGGLSVTEFRRFRCNLGLGYSEAIRRIAR